MRSLPTNSTCSANVLRGVPRDALIRLVIAWKMKEDLVNVAVVEEFNFNISVKIAT